MTDVGMHHFVKAGTGGHSVLIPQPSDDEHDPLVRLPYILHESKADRDRTGVRCGKALPYFAPL